MRAERCPAPLACMSACMQVEVLARLRHPNVVRFIEFFMDASSMLVIILEFCNAGDLAGLIKKRDGQLMSEATVMWLWVQIALALHYSHSNGVLHRDLKTSNVLCHNLARADAADACSTTTTTGPPPGPAAGLLLKLADFGVARCFDADSSLAGTVVGTPQYMCEPAVCRACCVPGLLRVGHSSGFRRALPPLPRNVCVYACLHVDHIHMQVAGAVRWGAGWTQE